MGLQMGGRRVPGDPSPSCCRLKHGRDTADPEVLNKHLITFMDSL